MKHQEKSNRGRLRRGAIRTAVIVGILALAVVSTAQIYTWNEPYDFVNDGQAFDSPLFVPPILEYNAPTYDRFDPLAGVNGNDASKRLPIRLTESRHEFLPGVSSDPSALKGDDAPQRLRLRLSEARHEFFPGVPSDVIQVNGLPVGPTVRVRTGEHLRLSVANDMGESATVHWHGMLLPAQMDGGPHQGIAPGTTWQPEWAVTQQPATLWYHAHQLHQTADHVYRGLVGMVLIDDDTARAALPSDYGVNDIPLIVQDRTFRDGRLTYNTDGGFANGNALTVNGVVGPFLEPDCETLRFRILNGANAHRFDFGFDDGRPFHVVASDAGLLESPVKATRVLLAPGERAEIVADFSDCADARLVSFPVQPDDGAVTNLAKGLFNLAPDEDRRFDVLYIRPKGDPGPSAALPTHLAHIPPLDPADASTERTFRLGGSKINGQEFDHDRVDFTVQRDTLEIWTITNPSFSYHPFHVHGVHFQVLERNGRPPPASEAGWKDTILVEPDDTVRIILRTPAYADLESPFMFHCHILEHEDKGMMGQFTVA